MIEDNTNVLFIKKLPTSYDLVDLQKSLVEFLKGNFNIKRGKKKGKNKKSSYAVITLSSAEDRLSLLNSNVAYNGIFLRFEEYKSPEQLFYQASNMLQRRIYINNFPPSVVRDEVLQKFTNYGEIDTLFLKKQIVKEGSEEEQMLIKSFVTFKDLTGVRKCFGDLPLFYKGCELELYQITTPERRISKKDSRQRPAPVGKSGRQGYYDNIYIKKKQGYNPQRGQYNRNNGRGGHVLKQRGGYHPPSSKINYNRREKRRNKATKLSKKSLKYKDRRRQEHHSPQQGRRGRTGKFAIMPFKNRAAEFNDWMGFVIKEYFSTMNLAPVSIASVPYQKRQGSNEIEGYDHRYANIRFNKIGI